MTTFNQWIDTFLFEKVIDPEECLQVEGPSGWNYIPVGVIVEMMKQAPKYEQYGIKRMVASIDFYQPGKDAILKYFAHLAQAIAK